MHDNYRENNMNMINPGSLGGSQGKVNRNNLIS